jgi:Holliday junction resolvase RusA-like endonuclease
MAAAAAEEVIVITLAEFNILGIPTPQGSKTRMPNGAMIEGSSTSGRLKHKSWRAAVAEAAQDQVLGEPLDGALWLVTTFRFPMPTSRPKAARVAGWGWKTTAPDLDKLVRALGDGLTQGGLIRDDARITRVWANKVEVIGWSGAEVWIGRGAGDYRERVA